MTWWRRYRELPDSIWHLARAEFLLNLMHPAQIIVLNIHMKSIGYTDAQIADLMSWNYLVILLAAIPLGFFVRGRRLKPILMTGALAMPVVNWILLELALAGRLDLMPWAYGAMGLAGVCSLVTSVPLILRLCDEENRSEGLTLCFTTWSLALVSCGVLVEGLHTLAGLDDPTIFRVFTGLAMLSWWSMARVREPDPAPVARREVRSDWWLLVRALSPTMVLSFGAGLTIPFMSLYFESVFGFTSNEFGRLGAGTGLLIIAGALANPSVKRRFGWGTAIVGMQVVAITMLIGLALTDFWSTAGWALPLACVLYILRQPLMNMTGPLSSELVMGYVGPRNREMLAAMQTGIWNGSWFLSARLFSEMRSLGWPYGRVFLVTAGLYAVSTCLMAALILDWRRRRDAGLIETESLSLE